MFTFIATLAASVLLFALIIVLQFFVAYSDRKDLEITALRAEMVADQKADKQEDLAHFREVKAAQAALIEELVRQRQDGESASR
jgi:hypothetical protein